VIIDHIGDRRAFHGVEPIRAVLADLDQAGPQIAPCTYDARKKQLVSDAALEEAYLVTGASTGSASCGTPPAAPASAVADP
jgi:hypothetical protein